MPSSILLLVSRLTFQQAPLRALKSTQWQLSRAIVAATLPRSLQYSTLARSICPSIPKLIVCHSESYTICFCDELKSSFGTVSGLDAAVRTPPMSRYPRTLFKGDERLRLPDAGRVGGGQPRSILLDPATLRYLTI